MRPPAIQLTLVDFQPLLNSRLGLSQPCAYCMLCRYPPWLPEANVILQSYLCNRIYGTAELYFAVLDYIHRLCLLKDSRYPMELRQIHDHYFVHIVQNQNVIPWLTQLKISV